MSEASAAYEQALRNRDCVCIALDDAGIEYTYVGVVDGEGHDGVVVSFKRHVSHRPGTAQGPLRAQRHSHNTRLDVICLDSIEQADKEKP
jgi:hypothetical protein